MVLEVNQSPQMPGHNISSPPKLTSNCVNVTQSHSSISWWAPVSGENQRPIRDLTAAAPLLTDPPPVLLLCSELTQVSCSWTELLRMALPSICVQLDNVSKSILLEFADATKEAEEGGRGDSWATLQRHWTACMARPTRTAGPSAEMRPCTQNAAVPRAAQALHAAPQLVHSSWACAG